jgi:hypothetical protein
VPCSFPDSFDGDFALTMASGSAERVFLQILVASKSGSATGQIDPFIFVDPTFANAAAYAINVDSRIGNALAVPEPGTWALLLAGLGGLGFAHLRRVRGARSASLGWLVRNWDRPATRGSSR